MRKPFAVALVVIGTIFLIAVVAGMASYHAPAAPGGLSPAVASAAVTPEQTPAQRAEYRKIDHMTNCGRIQRYFDTAIQTGLRQNDAADSLVLQGYADAASQRMQNLGC